MLNLTAQEDLRIAVEIRAAEIAAWPHHGFAARWRGCESCGWLAHERGLPINHDSPFSHRHNPSQYDAGYLARQIAQHDHDTRRSTEGEE